MRRPRPRRRPSAVLRALRPDRAQRPNATFAGTFTVQRFAMQAGRLVAVGTLTGTVTDTANVTNAVTQTVALPATVNQATCQILDLTPARCASPCSGL